MKPFVIFTAALIAFDLLASAGSAAESSRDDAPAIKQFLRGYLRKQVDTPDPSVRVAIAHADLKGNGQRDAVVYLSGGGYCGSGGCTTVVIVPKGQSYKVVMYEPITILPIKLLRTSTNGW
jgi:acetyl esterase/lipase